MTAPNLRFAGRLGPKGSSARVIYGQTDSVFVHLPDCTAAEAVSLGQQIGTLASQAFPPEMKLAFEKVPICHAHARDRKLQQQTCSCCNAFGCPALLMHHGSATCCAGVVAVPAAARQPLHGCDILCGHVRGTTGPKAQGSCITAERKAVQGAPSSRRRRWRRGARSCW